MKGALFVLLCVIALCLQFSEESTKQCPAGCECLELYVDCSNNNVSMPNIPVWAEMLDLSHNKLDQNVSMIFENLSNLKLLKLDKNHLTQLPNFLNNHLLDELSLNRNNIITIEPGHFAANCSLKTLILNNNFIERIEEGSLNNLTNLVTLKLNKNQINLLPSNLFLNQSKLRTLELNHNKLHVISGLVFKGLSGLITLRLKFNNLENIKNGAFIGFQSIELLQLDHNKIKSISKGWMYGLESLNTLSMSNNLISEIHEGSWERCLNLEVLDLSHNQLRSIESGTFQHLGNLQTLDLSFNNISLILQDAFNHMGNLQILTLSNNRISWTVEDMSGPFKKLQHLVHFSLENNQIRSINSRAFEGLSNLIELNLHGNNITSIQQHAFGTMSNLKKLHLNSTSLLCDCNLLWIVKWIKDKNSQKYITATCAYPAEVNGLLITKLKEDSCGDSPKPRILVQPQTLLAIKGHAANLVCSATSNPFSNMTFLWKKNNGIINNGYVYENITLEDKKQPYATSVLVIQNVTHSDSGKYQCIVSNNFGTTYSTKAKMIIVTFPRLVKSPVNITVKTGATVPLDCSASGDPTPEISWKKDGGNDFPAARERRMNVMPTDHIFYIVNTKTTDEGVYTCTATNVAGSVMANLTIKVVEAPSFVSIMENVEVVSGNSVVLKCIVAGTPTPVLKWYKDGKQISNRERYYLVAQGQLLVITNVETNDAGKFECEITNDLGTKKDITELKVLPPVAIMVNEEDMTGVIIITVVCCAVGTSIIWVVIIYFTRRRMARALPNLTTESIKMTQVVQSDCESPVNQLFPDNVSEHSSCKDSGTGDSAKQTSFDGVPTDRNDQVHFETVICGSYSQVPEEHKLLPSTFKPSIQVCVNKSVTPAIYSFSSHSVNE